MPKIKGGAYVINPDDKQSKSINNSIFRIQSDDCIMCEFYCIAFIEYIIAGKTFLHYTNLFSPIDNQKNDKIIYKYFKDKYGHWKCKPWL